jgi:hypothetical protein
VAKWVDPSNRTLTLGIGFVLPIISQLRSPTSDWVRSAVSRVGFVLQFFIVSLSPGMSDRVPSSLFVAELEVIYGRQSSARCFELRKRIWHRREIIAAVRIQSVKETTIGGDDVASRAGQELWAIRLD